MMEVVVSLQHTTFLLALTTCNSTVQASTAGFEAEQSQPCIHLNPKGNMVSPSMPQATTLWVCFVVFLNK